MSRAYETAGAESGPFTFGALLSPFDRQRFLAEIYGRQPLHLPGRDDRFDGLLGWEGLQELLAATPLWDNRSVALAVDGRTLPPEAFCYWATDRLGDRARRLDVAQIATLLRQGATLVVDFIDRLAPGIRAIAETLECVLQAPVTASAFVSWQRHQGYPPHFDTQQVFALQLVGRKAWRLYRGRFAAPAERNGFRSTDVPPEQKRQMMGEVEARIELTPGDLLYVPAGQFHEALALDEASLHVSFGVMQPTAQDFIESLVEALPQDPLFRTPLPHPDDDSRSRGTALATLSERLASILAAPATDRQLQRFQRAKAYDRWSGLDIAGRRALRRFRVRWRGARLHGNRLSLPAQEAPIELSPEGAELAAWALSRDLVSEDQILGSGVVTPIAAASAVEGLLTAGLLEPT